MEAQRKHDRGDLYRSLESARRKTPLDISDWVRVCTYRYSLQPLNGYGSIVGVGGRFNYGDGLNNIDAAPFPALYIGANRTVSYREYYGFPANERRSLTAQEFALTPRKDIAVIHICGRIHNVLDLTRISRLQDFVDIIKKYEIPNQVKKLAKIAGGPPHALVDTTDKLGGVLFEAKWRGLPSQYGLPAGCQTFGKLVWEAGYDAVLFRSTKGGGRCLAIYLQNLDKSDTEIWLSGTPPPDVVATLNTTNWQLSVSP